MVMDIFTIFLKVLELFECRRGFLYMTAIIENSFVSLTRNRVAQDWVYEGLSLSTDPAEKK